MCGPTHVQHGVLQYQASSYRQTDSHLGISKMDMIYSSFSPPTVLYSELLVVVALAVVDSDNPSCLH